METYLKSIDCQMWRIIIEGNIAITKVVDGKIIPKEENEYNDNDWNKASLNARATHFLYCALSTN